jgi:hypothetical protein
MKHASLSAMLLALLIMTSCSNAGKKDQNAEDLLKPSATDYLSPRTDTSFFAKLNLDFPGMQKVRKRVKQGDWTGAKAAYLEFRRSKSLAKWDVNPADKPATPAADNFPPADDWIMKHKIRPSTGAPEAILGEDINWEYNPVAPTEPYFTKEWTWQHLNRMPNWGVLSAAYWQTLDEKYAKEWVSQVIDWVKDNPVPLEEGPGSTLTWRTIESGIRMAGSWMNSYYHFLNSPSFTPEAHFAFMIGVIEHGQRLEKTAADFPDRSGNWVTMECNGLGTIGILFPELKLADRYRAIAFNTLLKELDDQVYPDGAQIELAPGYHQVSRSNFMELAKTAKANNVAIPEGYMDKLKKMYEFNLYLMDPSGTLPPFNDSGPTRTASSLQEAYEIWQDPRFLFGATLGKEGEKPDFDSYFFNYAGYYAMRSGWERKDNCLFFDAGPVGYGHEHEDMLNLYLYSRGKILLTEPGSYSYDLSEWRRFALSTPSHNTILVDGKEQHRADIRESRLISEPLKNPWVTTALFDYGAGTYSSGYQENRYKPVQYMPKEYVGPKDTSVSHNRHVIFLRPWYFIEVDFLEGTGVHTYESHFHLDAPDAVMTKGAMSVQTMRKDSVQLGLWPMDTDRLQAKIVKGQENPLLGWMPRDKRPIPTVVYLKKQETPAVFSTLIYPYYLSVPEVSYANITGNSSLWGKKITTPYESAAVVINRAKSNVVCEIDPLIAPEFKTDAKVSIIRVQKGKNQICLGFYELNEFNDNAMVFNADTATSILIVKDAEGRYIIFNPGEKDIKLSFSLPLKKEITLTPKKWTEVSSSGISERTGELLNDFRL